MRIAFVVPGFGRDEADPGIPVLVDVLRQLQRHASVFVLALRYPEPAMHYRVHGIDVETVAGGDASGLRRMPQLARALRALRAEHRRNPFTAIHGLWADEPGAVAVAAGRILDIPAVVSVMGGELVSLPDIGYGGKLSRINRRLDRFALGRADAVTAGSRSAVESMLSVVPASRHGRAHRLPWGIDPEVLSRSSVDVDLAGSYRVLQVGSLERVKGPDLLIRAAGIARLRVPDIHLHLVGDGSEREALPALAERLGMAGRVTLHGHVPREKLASYYRAADVLAVASRHELQPVVALEAAYCGLPVIGSDVGVIRDWAPNAALVAPTGDIDALAALLVRCADGEERMRLARAAERTVREDYLAGHTAARLVDLYASLASCRAGLRIVATGGVPVTAGVVKPVNND